MTRSTQNRTSEESSMYLELKYFQRAAAGVLFTCSALLWMFQFSISPVFAQPTSKDPDAKGGKPIRIICFGAHPDDAEYKSGGSAALWAQAGHEVKLVSVTNGDIGHWAMAGGLLAHCRISAGRETLGGHVSSARYS
jgi:hypothetical protein